MFIRPLINYSHPVTRVQLASAPTYTHANTHSHTSAARHGASKWGQRWLVVIHLTSVTAAANKSLIHRLIHRLLPPNSLKTMPPPPSTHCAAEQPGTHTHTGRPGAPQSKQRHGELLFSLFVSLMSHAVGITPAKVSQHQVIAFLLTFSIG